MPRSEYDEKCCAASLAGEHGQHQHGCSPALRPGPASFRGRVQGKLLSSAKRMLWPRYCCTSAVTPLSLMTVPEHSQQKQQSSLAMRMFEFSRIQQPRAGLPSRQRGAGALIIFKEPKSSHNLKPLSGEETLRSNPM